MKRHFFIAAAAVGFLTGSVSAQTGWLSRYWDGCKPSCAWTDNAGAAGATRHCDMQDRPLATGNGQQSSCRGGTSFTCWDMIPWVSSNDPLLAYGFVATTPPNTCGTCWELTFVGRGQHGTHPTHQALTGRRMIVMATNIGGDVGVNQFDLLVPGGGVGLFDSFSWQLGLNSGYNPGNQGHPSLGHQYGGFLRNCGDGALAPTQACVRERCNTVFAGTGRREWLRAGCNFYVDWLMAANNPEFTRRTVACPAELLGRHNSHLSGSPTNPTFVNVLSINRNIADRGTVTVNGSPAFTGTATSASSTHTGGVQITLVAAPSAGFSFTGWSGSCTGTNTTCAVTMNQSHTVTASFGITGAVNHTLTVRRAPPAGGSITVNGQAAFSGSQSSVSVFHPAGTTLTLAAAPSAGNMFTGWSGACTGTGSCVITMSQDREVTANFASTTNRLTVTRSPSTGGTVTLNGTSVIGNSTHPAGAVLTLVPVPNEGYSFSNWSGACVGTGPCQVTMSADQTVTANFISGSAPTQHVLTVNRSVAGTAVNGVVMINGVQAFTNTAATAASSHPAGTSLTLTALAEQGFAFAGWSGAGCTGTGNCVVNMTGPQTVTANFIVSVSVLNRIDNYRTHWGIRRTSSGVLIAGPVGTSADVIFYNIRGAAVYRQSVTGGYNVNIGSGAVPAGSYIVVLRDRVTGRELHRSQVSFVN
ncbi:MAG: hypothetical protein FWE57_03710 [Chitinispirillia bacterium]|nr:hypothetical protein [Chitinispirillia bacterium]